MSSNGVSVPPVATPPTPRDEARTSEPPVPRPSSSHYQSIGAFPRNLGTSEAFAIIIGIVVGSGVFTSPGSIDTNVPSPGVALIVWLVGGVLAWTGAATLAELGTAIPGEGGVQPYLAHIFGDYAGFLAAWTWIVAVMPATLAILAIVFVESIYSAFGIPNQASSILHKLLSVIVLVATGAANSISTRASTRLNEFFVVTKFTTVLAVVVAGVAVVGVYAWAPQKDVGGGDWHRRNWFAVREGTTPEGDVIDWDGLGAWEILGYFSTALYAALWAYSGWDKAIYISSELSAPARQLPLAINSALPTAAVCFLAANAAYYVLLPWNIIPTTDSVAVTAISRLLGPVFGAIAAVLVCLVVAGSLLGNSFVAGRMTVAAAGRTWLPAPLGFVGHIRPRESAGHSSRNGDADENTILLGDSSRAAPAAETSSDAPYNALLLSTILSSLYVLFGNFRALLTFNGLGEYVFFFLTVAGAILLRFREPDLRRPYKPVIAIPITFAIVSGLVVIRGAVFEPYLASILIVVWGAGLTAWRIRAYQLSKAVVASANRRE